MSIFKRAEWKSGLTYRQTCDQCNTVITYTDDILDFRPWFADGFIYCPKCQKPLRHRETFAINGSFTVETAPAGNTEGAAFCSQCGHSFNATDRFCAQCGAKR